MRFVRRTPLPIDAILPAIREHFRSQPNLVIEAPPGAGKTTRVPPALLDVINGEVLVLEPRRLAARLAARRVAAELGERVGDTAGYRVRFEECAGPRTRITFMTEGVLTRRLLADRSLAGVGAVLLDEFHERHLEGDLALALLRRLQRGQRPDLRIGIMSATLEAAPAAAYLGHCATVRSEGQLFPVSVEWTPASSDTLEMQVAKALDGLVRRGLDGDVLVFLPGAAEIRKAARAVEAAARRLLVLPLHGDLTAEEQDRAVQPAERRKVILSTNVAESSVTIEGVTAVIDSGLARVASHSPWSGLPRLAVSRISKASAKQRAGRAGRTAPGRVIRLYSLEDYQRRPEHDSPEVSRAELSPIVLLLAGMGIRDRAALEWLEAPPKPSLDSATELLCALGAIDAHGAPTAEGRTMARIPAHPRLARLALEAARRGARDQGCAVAALLGTGARLPAEAAHDSTSDLHALIETDWDEASRCACAELKRLAPRSAGRSTEDEALERAALAAFPDRVARRRKGDEFALSSGGSAVLSRSSAVRSAAFLVAVDVEERSDRGGAPLVRIASAIEPEWLLEMFPERIRERRTLEWNRATERVEAVAALFYDELVLDETRRAPAGADEPWRLLVEYALEAGPERFCDAGELEAFLSRLAFASRHPSLPLLGPEDVRAALAELCEGLCSFSELQAAGSGGGLIRVLSRRLPPGGARLLDEIAPARLQLPAGKHVPVHYPRGEPPWIAAKLQEFFGMRESPRVANGQVPVVIRLLAPSNRPVQTTTDLAGFWQRLYPVLRRDLGRRYPRHRWPENPLEAAPGERLKRRE